MKQRFKNLIRQRGQGSRQEETESSSIASSDKGGLSKKDIEIDSDTLGSETSSEQPHDFQNEPHGLFTLYPVLGQAGDHSKVEIEYVPILLHDLQGI
jgi:hypothetical protein